MVQNNKNFGTIRNGRAVGNRTDTMVYDDYNSVGSFVNLSKKRKPTGDGTGGAFAGKDFIMPRFKRLVWNDLRARLNVNSKEIDALLDMGLTEEEAYRLAFKDAKEEDFLESTKNVLKKIARVKKPKKVYREDFKSVRSEALDVVRFIKEQKNLKAIMLGYTDKNGFLPSNFGSSDLVLKLREVERKIKNVAFKIKKESGGSDICRLNEFDKQSSSVKLDKLLHYFSPEHFYSLSNNQILPLLQEVASAYAGKNGYKAPKVVAADFDDPKGYVTHGAYCWGLKQVNINRKHIELFEKAKQYKNEELPIRLLQTIIHETDHFLQDRRNLKQLASASNFSSPKGFAEYLSDPREAEARRNAQMILDHAVKIMAIKKFNKGYLRLSAETKKLNKIAQLEGGEEFQRVS